MSLSTALSIAHSALLNTSRQTSVVSRNISEGSNTDYARRSAIIVSSANGARSVAIQRATDDVLCRQHMAALSSAAAQPALLDGLNRLTIDVYGLEYATSPATAIGRFQEALQTYSANPSNPNVAEAALEAARQVVRVLN